MMRCTGPRCYFPDEEPEKEFVSLAEVKVPGCTFCGLEGHKHDVCPNRPLSDVFRP